MAEIINDKLEYIPIEKSLVPYEFEIILNEKLYTFFINYNTQGDFFTADLKLADEALVQGEKILLDNILFRQLYEDVNSNLDEKYPNDMIMAQSTNDKVDRLGYEQMEENCFLYVFNRQEVLNG